MKVATSKVIEIVVAPDGQTRVETKGFVGAQCREATRFLQALGTSTGEYLTSEFYQTVATQQAVQEGNSA
jgi:hypothetical protein